MKLVVIKLPVANDRNVLGTDHRDRQLLTNISFLGFFICYVVVAGI